MTRAPGALASAVAAAELGLFGLVAPVAAPAAAALAVRNAARTRARTPEVVDAIARVVDGAAAAGPFRRVARLPADARVVITSDLHRATAGASDWPHRQDVVGLYGAMLDHYGHDGRHLIEDGDVEDLWMVGGSTWGAAYGTARLAAAALRGPVGRLARAAVYRAHLERIVEHNAGTYERIQERFGRHGRYWRVLGNHDDALASPAVADVLRQVHPGLDVLDAVVVGSPGEPSAFVSHGHHTDAWNAPDLDLLGKAGTWLACHLRDLPLLGLDPGLEGADPAGRLLGGEQPDRLTAVHRLVGANAQQYSLDEVDLFGAFARRWSSVDRPDGRDPILVLGHTHLPVAAPVAPDGRRWWRYWNSGSGVGAGVVTAVELDGARQARLVVWCRADQLPAGASGPTPVAEDDRGRPVVRLELSPAPDGSALRVAAPEAADG